MKKREVKIELMSNTYFVMYAGRNKYQRYSAAQFDASDHDIDFVKNWIADQKNLILIS